jgi:hypothetical protein
MTEVEQQIRLVSDFKIQCVFVGGLAAFIHGASIRTRDLAVCYSRDKTNLIKVVQGLRSVNALLRGAPEEIPFILDEETLARGLNFTFETEIGDFDLFGEVQGVGDFAECLRNSDEVEIFDARHHVLSLDKLIAAKLSAGRPKDLLILPELEALREYRRKAESRKIEQND